MSQTPTLTQVRAAWDTIAPRFDAYITPHSIRQGEEILDRLDLEPGTRLLDVACGSGALAIPGARRGAEVTAVDIAPRMIELLDARARLEELRITGRVMDAHQLELPDDDFDVSVSLNGVTMSQRLGATLAEMVRVTRPGGTVLVAAFGPPPRVEFLSTFLAGVRAAVSEFPGLPTSPPPPPFQLADPEVFVRALADAGLHDVAVETVIWNLPVGSAADLWNEVASSNPIGAELVATLDEHQKHEVLRLLDGILRDRFGGRQDGVLQAAVNVGTGTV